MKKLLKNFMVGSMALIMIMVNAVAVHANDGISVTIDGERVHFEGQQPALVDGRTLVPVRGVFEMLGFDVDWDGATSTAIITNADYAILITIGSDVFVVNGVPHTLDVPAQIIGGSTMVPIRLPLESVGFDVDWDGVTSTVLIATMPMFGELGFQLDFRYVQTAIAPEPLLSLLDARSVSMVHIEYDGHTVFLQDQALGGATRQYLDNLVRGLEQGMFRVAYGDMDFVTTILDFPLSYLQYTFFAERGLLERINPDHMGGIARARVQQPPSGEQQASNQGQVSMFFHNTNWYAPFSHANSSISLPRNRRLTDAEMQAWRNEYATMGGVSDIERELVRLVNIERQNRGIAPVEIDETLSMAVRFHSQMLANADYIYNLPMSTSIIGVHSFGAYGGSMLTARYFGASGLLGGVGSIGAASGRIALSPEQSVNGWMLSTFHSAVLLNPSAMRIGVGVQTGASGQTYWYALTARAATAPTTRLNVTFASESGEAISGNNVRFIDNSTGLINEQGAISIQTEPNMPVSITAEPRAEHIEFVRWEVVSGNATITNPYSATTTIAIGLGAVEDGRVAGVHVHAVFRHVAPTTSTARFSVNVHDFNPNPIDRGHVTVNGISGVLTIDGFSWGETANIMAHPVAGYRFVEWSTPSMWGVVSDRNNPNTTLTFANPSGITPSDGSHHFVELIAIFEQTNTTATAQQPPATTPSNDERIFILGISTHFGNGNTITYDRSASIDGTFRLGDVVTLTANPAPGWRFVEWAYEPWVRFSDSQSPNTTITFIVPDWAIPGSDSGLIAIAPIFEQITLAP